MGMLGKVLKLSSVHRQWIMSKTRQGKKKMGRFSRPGCRSGKGSGVQKAICVVCARRSDKSGTKYLVCPCPTEKALVSEWETSGDSLMDGLEDKHSPSHGNPHLSDNFQRGIE